MTITRKLLLTSTAFAVVTAAPFSSKAEDAKADPNDFWAAHGGVSFSGEFEVGGRAFIQRPPHSATPWVAPVGAPGSGPNGGGPRDNVSKFEEYGKIAPGFYAEYLRMTAQSNDGMYWHELRADNIGNNNQRYVFDYSKAGEHYFTASWDQIPHLYNTSALSIWGGVGGNYLTTNVTIPGNALSVVGAAPPFGSPPLRTTDAQRQAMTNALAGKVRLIDVGIERDKGSVAYRWTPDPNWDIKASYSHERRDGIQTSGVAMGGLGAAGLAQLQVPRPIDDTTQIGKLTTQYFGSTPWGGHYNVQVGGGLSLFDNKFSSFEVQNPFYDSSTAATRAVFTPVARISLMPSNQAYNGVATTGVDLPFKTRWNSTFQYTTMRQNDPFMPFTDNPNIATFALPASSLNGEVNTLLYNTNMTTVWTPEFRSTFRYRYYDNDNRTPELLMPSYVVEDSSATGTAAGIPRRSLAMGYTKQNSSEEFQWRPNKWATLGTSFGWEQWDRTRRDANVTNEFIGRVTADFKLYDVGTLRTSGQYSERRYNNYDSLALAQSTYYAAYISTPPSTTTNANTGTNILMRKFDMANRNETKANVFLDLSGPSGTVFRDFVLTPTAGLRFDDYPDDPLTFGLKRSNTWNAGIDGTYVFKPGNSIQVSYLYETYDRFQAGSGTLTNSLTGLQNVTAANPFQAFVSNTHEKVHTIMVSANGDLIPGVLDFKVGYSISLSNEDWDYGAYGTYVLQNNGVGYSPFPTVKNNLQRLDTSVRYTVDPTIVSKMGWLGEVYVKARYIWERNNVQNWQQDGMSPYLYLVDTTLARMIDMGATNPNYNAQFFQLSLNAKW